MMKRGGKKRKAEHEDSEVSKEEYQNIKTPGKNKKNLFYLKQFFFYSFGNF